MTMTRATVRKKAKANGHTLGQFQARFYNTGAVNTRMYSIAHCTKCEAAAFADITLNDDDVNPALDYTCEEYSS